VIVIRRCPFQLFYVVRDHFVVVAALAHTSRSIDAQLERR